MEDRLNSPRARNKMSASAKIPGKRVNCDGKQRIAPKEAVNISFESEMKLSDDPASVVGNNDLLDKVKSFNKLVASNSAALNNSYKVMEGKSESSSSSFSVAHMSPDKDSVNPIRVRQSKVTYGSLVSKHVSTPGNLLVGSPKNEKYHANDLGIIK